MQLLNASFVVRSEEQETGNMKHINIEHNSNASQEGKLVSNVLDDQQKIDDETMENGSRRSLSVQQDNVD